MCHRPCSLAARVDARHVEVAGRGVGCGQREGSGLGLGLALTLSLTLTSTQHTHEAVLWLSLWPARFPPLMAYDPIWSTLTKAYR